MATYMNLRHAMTILAAFCAIAFLASSAQTAAAVDLRQIVANNDIAVRGPRAIRRIASMRIELAMKDGKSAFDAQYTVTRDGKMRIDIIQGGNRVYTEAYDGREGWDLGEDGQAPVLDTNAAALWHGTQFPGQIFTLSDVIENGHRIRYIGRETIDGVNYYVLEITLSDGFTTFRYINPTSWLIERGRDFRAFHPAINDKKTWIETIWSDYRTVEGLKLAFSSVNTDLTSGQWQATNTVTAIKINPPVDSAIFNRPSTPRS
jgi:hypothetical protein